MEETGPTEAGLVDLIRCEIEPFVSSLADAPVDRDTTTICGQDCGSICWCCEPLPNMTSFDSILEYAAGAAPTPAEDEEDAIDADEIAEAKRTTLINLLAEMATKTEAVNVCKRFVGCMGPLRTKRIMESEPSDSEIASSLDAMLEPIIEAIFLLGKKASDPASVPSSEDEDDDEPPAKRVRVSDEE